MSGHVGALVHRLRGALGVEPSAREMAEALWLAQHLGRAEPDRSRQPAEPPVAGDQRQPASPSADSPAPPRPEPTPLDPPGRAHLHARPPTAPGSARAADPHAGSTPVRAPVAPTLPNPLPLQRALRPLQHYRPPVRTAPDRLDEQATAERAAESGLLLPVMRAGTRREARLRLLMDVSTSTVVWQSTLEELRQVCAGVGAFREVPAHYVHEGADGRLLAGTSPDPGCGTLRPAEQLRDPTGRQLTLVLSDCAGPLWRSGRMQRLLHHWGLVAPVAVVQPLPQRMWRRTHLPALPGRLRRREGLGARLEFRPDDTTGAPPAPPTPGHPLVVSADRLAVTAHTLPAPPHPLPVPVLAPARHALGAWARLLSGNTGLSLPAAAAWVRADHPAGSPRTTATAADATTLVEAFRGTASRQAVSLAVCFSAVPLALPVMQLVQRVMLPRSGPAVLAEVLLGGLLRRGDDDGWYEFVPGVREELLRLLPRGDALLLLKHCGAYVERHFGRRARNFPALALAQLTGDPTTAGDAQTVPKAFAEVSALVVGRYGGRPTGVRSARPRKFVVVSDERDLPWATWLASVLGACGHEVTLRPWDGGNVVFSLTPSVWARPRADREVLLLLGDRTDGSAEAWESLRRLDRLLTLDVRSDGLSSSAVPVRAPDVSLAAVTEGVARWLLLGRLGIDQGAYAPGRALPDYPGPAHLIIGDLPERTPGYVYREDVFEQLRAVLGPQAAVASCALIGSPSGGKSYAAAEYVRRHADEYDFVWWIRGRDEAERLAEAGRFADILGLLPPTPVGHLGALLRDLGSANIRWLIVHDGWDDLDGASQWLFSGGHVLVTTRDSAWEEIMPSVRIRTVEEAELPRPEADREELVRRALVRIHDTAGGGLASGFFVAPGWAVSSEPFVDRWRHPSVEVITMDGQSYRGEQVHRIGDLALVHVPDAIDPDCLWLSDLPQVSPGTAATLYMATGASNAVHPRSIATTLRSARGRDALTTGGEPLPLDSRGGPLVDAVHGSVVGVVTRPGLDAGGAAVRVGLLRMLCQAGRAELWHGIVREHDRHHARRLRERGSYMTWTGVHEWLAGRSLTVGKLSPAERTELYGHLAELPPPERPEIVVELLGELRDDRYPPYSWRDGVGLMHPGDSADLALTYAARVWAELAARGGSAWDAGLVGLRAWITRTARTRDQEVQRAVVDVFESMRGVMPFSDDCLLVDVWPRLPVRERYLWSITRIRGDERVLLSEGEADHHAGVPHDLGRQLMDAVRDCGIAETGTNVMFSLPAELVWAPPWEERTVAELTGPPGGTPRSVVVRARDRVGRPSDPWLRRWNALLEGPLRPVRLPASSGTLLRVLLEEAPPSAVVVGCLHEPAALHEAWRHGCPLILWSRAELHQDCGEFHERAEELVEWAPSPGELLSRVARLRILNAGAEPYPDAAWVRHLVIHYDPPNLP
ncbi:SAV_2336 N-terminal domain-related protein [Streptomyces sp. M41]|uniref:SAV_2336 N-terminal domain-related protein n=1 Tax=Streptomyces sp. M41 TaxID=3059412 RepID=UPI00374D1A1A